MSGAVDPALPAERIRELRESVAALRAQLQAHLALRAAEPSGGSGLAGRLAGRLRRALEEVNVFERLEALRGRAGSLGMQPRREEIDPFGFDRAFLGRSRGWLDFLYERWWRVHASGGENLPARGPVLLVANRSGVLPWDALMIAHAVERASGGAWRPRFLVADWLVGLPFAPAWLARLGGVRACRENAERLLRAGHGVIVFPEGPRGALKPFRERYRVQRFARGGFASLAIGAKAKVIPVSVVGAEEAHPLLLPPEVGRRMVGLPLPVTPTFPLLGPLGLVPLPSQWRIRFGEPIAFEDAPEGAADDPLFLTRRAEEIRSVVQAQLDEELARRGTVFSS